jgi:hypothetical protein
VLLPRQKSRAREEQRSAAAAGDTESEERTPDLFNGGYMHRYRRDGCQRSAKTDRLIRNSSRWATPRLCELVSGEIIACDGRPERLEERLNKGRD